MAMTVRIALTVTFLTFVSCVHLQKRYSSYFKFSHQKQKNQESDKIAEFKAETELACALRCSAKGNCDEATFYSNAKKCFLYQRKGKGSTELYANDNDNTGSKIVTIKKVRKEVRKDFHYRHEFLDDFFIHRKAEKRI